MQMITDLIGNPDSKLINMIEDEDNKTFMKKLPKRKGMDLKELFKGYSNPDAIDLISKMLVFDPEKRITIEKALAHPYMKNLHFIDDEPVGSTVPPFDFDFELFSLRTSEFKELIYNEIQLYHSEEAVSNYNAQRAAHPNGVLHLKYSKDRLRTMYRTDPKFTLAAFNAGKT